MSLGSQGSFFLGSSGQGGGGYAIERSLRFNSGDSASLTKAFSATGSQTTYTLSFWLKKNNSSSVYQNIIIDNNATSSQIRINDLPGGFELRFAAAGASAALTTNRKFRDPSAWYHIVCVYDSTNATSSDRMRIYVNGVRETSFLGETQPSQNLASDFITNGHTYTIGYYNTNTALDGYLADIHFIDGQALAATDFGEFDLNSVWQPIAFAGTYGTNGFHLDFSDTSSSAALGTDSSGNGNTWTVNNLVAASGIGPGITSTVPQDLTGDWRGIIGIVPSNTSGAVAVFPDGGGIANPRGTFFWTGLTIGDTITWYGTTSASSARNVTGDIDETSVSVPGASLGSFELTVNAASGSAKIDFNGTANCYGITPGPVSSQYNDALRDSPVNGDSANDTGAGGEITGNYATWNPLVQSSSTFSNGNLQVTTSGVSGYPLDTANFYTPAGTGKWYWEFELDALIGSNYTLVGMIPGDSSYQQGNSNIPTEVGGLYVYIGLNGSVAAASGAATAGTATATFAVGDILGWAFDAENGTLQCYKNGVSQGTQFTNIRTDIGWVFCVTDYDNSATATYVINFGQRSWAYAAPSNYKALCTANLPDPTIADGSTAMDVVTYTGNGSTQSITGLGFSPDLVWCKRRSGVANHHLYDIVRGATERLQSSTTSAESTAVGGVTSFDSDGWTMGNDADINGASNTFVGWTWDGGSSTVTNTDGDITSSVRVNQAAGFSIVKWTSIAWTGSAANRQVGHGLNAAPSLIITKGMEEVASWYTYHKDLDATNPNDYYLTLNTTTARDTLADSFGPNIPDSTTFGDRLLGWSKDQDVIAYCFAPVSGYSSFGGYTGNGSATDGPFVFTGFAPSFVMIKNISASSNWIILDNARDPVNVASKRLSPNLSNAEDPSGTLDFTSTGFKIRRDGQTDNISGNTYIYIAFASHPFKTARAR